MSFAEDFASALVADLMASEMVAKGLVREGLLREVLMNDLKTPLGIPAVVFDRVRVLLHKNPHGLGQLDFLSTMLTKLVDVGASIGGTFLKQSLQEDALKFQTDQALRLAQEQTKAAQLAYAASQQGAMGMSSIFPTGASKWMLPLAAAGAAAFFILPRFFGGRRKARR
jgi:hypothetical protein